MNLGEAKTKTIKLMNEYSNNGNLSTPVENADFLLRMNSFIDDAQKELAKIKKIPAVYSISQNTIQNQLGEKYEIKQHLNDDLTDMTARGSKAYYFEIDGQATVYIEEEIAGTWTVLDTISINAASFTAYKGLITASDTNNNIRVRFSGDYPYNVRNRALYAYTFASDSAVPNYGRYIKYTMPADYMELNKVIQQDNKSYKTLQEYYWENPKTVILKSNLKGSIDVHYFKYPATITDTTEDDTELEIDIDAQECIPFHAAAHILMAEDMTRQYGVMLLNEYEAKKAMLVTRDNNVAGTIQNKMGW